MQAVRCTPPQQCQQRHSRTYASAIPISRPDVGARLKGVAIVGALCASLAAGPMSGSAFADVGNVEQLFTNKCAGVFCSHKNIV